MMSLRVSATDFVEVAAHRRARPAVGDGLAEDHRESGLEQRSRTQRRRVVVDVALAVLAVAQRAVLLVVAGGLPGAFRGQHGRLRGGLARQQAHDQYDDTPRIAVLRHDGPLLDDEPG
jgi:hypothetical protein